MGPAASLPPAGIVTLPGSAYADPAYSIEDPIAVTGLAFASDNSSLGADYVEDLFVASYVGGRIHRFELAAGRDALAVGDDVANSSNELDQHLFASGFTGGVTDLKEGPDGALYVVAYGLGAIYKIEGAGGPVVHDLAVRSLKAPRKVALRGGAPATRKLTVTVANTGTGTATVADLAELGELVALAASPLTGDCPAAPAATLVPPKKGFPVVLAPRKKLKLTWTVAFDCAAADPTAVEFEWDVALDAAAIGATDAVPANDVCPRPPAGDDRGCGGKPAGSAVRTNVSAR
jgi:hypothetical protein